MMMLMRRLPVPLRVGRLPLGKSGEWREGGPPTKEPCEAGWQEGRLEARREREAQPGQGLCKCTKCKKKGFQGCWWARVVPGPMCPPPPLPPCRGPGIPCMCPGKAPAIPLASWTLPQYQCYKLQNAIQRKYSRAAAAPDRAAQMRRSGAGEKPMACRTLSRVA